MSNEFSLSELYEVFIKTTYPVEIGEKTFQAGETLCVFDKVQIANFNEIKEYVTARGGFNNLDRVFWETTKEVDLTFSQGIFNHLQFALLSNARMLYIKNNSPILISKREEKESNENGIFVLDEIPNGDFFLYNKENGSKIEDYFLSNKREINIKKPFVDVIADYTYVYSGGAQWVTIGNRLIEGFLTLEGKTRVKDDISGKVRTGIIKIPKLKLMSDLSMRLGKNANPVVANFRAKALPSGNRGSSEVMNILFLNEEIDSDI